MSTFNCMCMHCKEVDVGGCYSLLVLEEEPKGTAAGSNGTSMTSATRYTFLYYCVRLETEIIQLTFETRLFRHI